VSYLFGWDTAHEQIAIRRHEEGHPILTGCVPSRFPFLSDKVVLPIDILNKMLASQLFQHHRVRDVSPFAPESTVGSLNKVHPIPPIFL
jgi:hypothetical protein